MSLNNKNAVMVEDFLKRASEGVGDSYMLTIARDGESPVRSIYFYENAVDAVKGYEAYQDWGFAKDYLTVELYEPNGRLHSKVLTRPRGGECAFHREQYHQISEILNAVKSTIEEETFNSLTYKFAKLFSQDNQRFNADRFFDNLGYTGERND